MKKMVLQTTLLLLLLAAVAYAVQDLGACAIDNGGCEYVCQPPHGVCSCTEGSLRADTKSCDWTGYKYAAWPPAITLAGPAFKSMWGVALSIDHDFTHNILFYSSYETGSGEQNITSFNIKAGNLINKQSVIVNNTQGRATHLTYDPTTESLYFATDRFINKMENLRKVNGTSSPISTIADVGGKIEGLEWDPCSEMLFVINGTEGAIYAASVTDGSLKPIVSGLVKPKSLTINHVGSKLTWISEAGIEESNYDGSCRRLITPIKDYDPHALSAYKTTLTWLAYVTNATAGTTTTMEGAIDWTTGTSITATTAGLPVQDTGYIFNNNRGAVCPGKSQCSNNYVVKTSLTCTTSMSEAQCHAIARQRGASEAIIINLDFRPKGCYVQVQNGVVWFNRNNTMVNCTSERVCLCQEDPKPPVSAEAITVKCSELGMTAALDTSAFEGRIVNTTLLGCYAGDYTMSGNIINAKFADCARNVTQDAEQIILENVVAVRVDGAKHVLIERITVYYFKVRCIFNRRINVTNAQVVNVVDAKKWLEMSSRTNFSASMNFYKTVSFSELAANPLQVAAYEPIYIQIKGEHNNKLFKFVVEECFATSSESPKDTNRYMFFGDKCGIDRTFKEHNKNVRNEFSFSVGAFRFIRLKNQVFFHCKLLVCKNDTESAQCSQSCTQLNRKRRAISDDALERVTVSGGAIQHKRKPSCRDISCPTNNDCVDLFPAVCRCSDGFVLHQKTNQCKNTNLLSVFGLHLNAPFRNAYYDTYSIDFIRLATKVERDLNSSYSLNHTIITGVKVIRAREGSVILDMVIMHAEAVTPQDAFNYFIASVFRSGTHDNILAIKKHILPTREMQFENVKDREREEENEEREDKEREEEGRERKEEDEQKEIIAAAILLPLVVMSTVALVLWFVYSRKCQAKSKKPVLVSFSNDGMTMYE